MKITLPKDYVEKVYAGWLGKIIGVRHGSNIEGWKYDKIKTIYGEIEGYLYDFKNFAADDDTNGPYFFIRALDDYTYSPDITAEQIGRTWLNYAPYEHGFYWWGGYGVSTEHTAYLNLRSGIPAPRSGSILQNGAAVAEQIGGQIFIDTWGLVVPCDYQLAAEYAAKAASVSHDGNGIYGGMFIAACISAAFEKATVGEVIGCGLSVIPEDCEYRRMSRDVLEFHRKNPDDWRACFAFVHDHYGYDRYPGACHIIPNSAIVLLSLLYGGGDFSHSINICNMCGWDTDCNVANVGSILGVLHGLDGIDQKWRRPINDLLISSSVVGSLNILDIPGCAYHLAALGYKIAGQEPEPRWAASLERGERSYDFELPGATHSFRISSTAGQGADLTLENSRQTAFEGEGSLKVTGKFFTPGDEIHVFLRTYYRPADFSDSRYDPAFSPILYPGQTLRCALQVDAATECGTLASLYVRDGNTGETVCSAPAAVVPSSWMELTWDIPRMEGACIEEAGIRFICEDGARGTPKSLLAFIDSFEMGGTPDYRLDFSRERIENWTPRHHEVSQFTYLKGIWELADGGLYGSCADYGESYTGNVNWRNYAVTATLQPVIGEDHRILFRVQGAMRSYAVGLAAGGRLALYKNENGYRVLQEVPFDWQTGKKYTFRIEVKEDRISVLSGSECLIAFHDTDRPYLNGQVGFGVAAGSRCAFSDLDVGPC